MKNKISNYITNILSQNNIIPSEQVSIYTFCFEYFLDQIEYIFIILLLGLLFNNFLTSVVILFISIPIRTFAGGFHANTRVKCSFFTYLIDITLIVGTTYLPHINKSIYMLCFLLSCILIICISPVIPPEKNIDLSTYKKLKTKTNISLIIITILYLLLFFTEYANIYRVATITILLMSILILIGKLKYSYLQK